ncbi:MAG: 23S rRNA (guanosine(2251)-2'-O)-methyltransferase RlmB [Oscillospiraceae bacterium]|jgi:23S rRNA (guanosine2251-2'-O)-methyltransferase|nr:23S rRNA (guanosine(2251)-2'-O)-methyltransferase RlmB [Oscillospiraceae bacterium]
MDNEKQFIIGKNSVTEALRAGRPIDSILISRNARPGSLSSIIAKAKEAGVTVKDAAPIKLDSLCGGENHQGVIAFAAVAEYASLEDLLALAEERGEPPFLIIADEIEDPHNLGAIIRTAEAAGAHGIIIPKRRAVGLTYTVGKASAGAVEHIPVARVSNLAQCIDELKSKGIWIYGIDMEGQSWHTCDLKGSAAFVIGNEGHGISRLIKEKCDFTLSLPMLGKVNSLNASVAAGIVLYEAVRQRLEARDKK